MYSSLTYAATGLLMVKYQPVFIAFTFVSISWFSSLYCLYSTALHDYTINAYDLNTLLSYFEVILLSVLYMLHFTQMIIQHTHNAL